MRDMKTPRRLRPLFPALGLVAGSLALSFLVKSSALDMAMAALFFPARLLTILVLPDVA
jgi:hypothetical protein